MLKKHGCLERKKTNDARNVSTLMHCAMRHQVEQRAKEVMANALQKQDGHDNFNAKLEAMFGHIKFIQRKFKNRRAF